MRRTRNTRLRHFSERLLTGSLDAIAARVIKPCDVFIGMSGMSTKAATAVRRRYGASVWIERGSRHILSQKEILENIRGMTGKPVSDNAVKRELADYALADTVVIPSLHVERSFLERGCPREKLFRNPYGVDLKMFPPTLAPVDAQPTIIMAGTWSFQKGCDVLVTAWRHLRGVRLIHVGSAGDAPMPDSPDFEHHETVPMSRLKEFYSRAHVFVLASRQEGLALVQAQALGCGLRLVCTDRTGGEDLRELLPDPGRVTVVPPDDADVLRSALAEALRQAVTETGLRDFLGSARTKLSWRAYGERYSAELVKRVAPTAQSKPLGESVPTNRVVSYPHPSPPLSMEKKVTEGCVNRS